MPTVPPESSLPRLMHLPHHGPLFQGEDVDNLRAYLSTLSDPPNPTDFLKIQAPAIPEESEVRSWRIDDGYVLFDDQTQADRQREEEELDRLRAEHEAAFATENAAFYDWLSLSVGASHQGVDPEDTAAWKQIGADYDAARAVTAALDTQMKPLWARSLLRSEIASYHRFSYPLFLVRLFGSAIRASRDAPRAGSDPDAPIHTHAAGYLTTVKRAASGKGYEATAVALPGLSGTGGTQATAVRRLEQAIPGYLAALRALGRPIPAPPGSDTPDTTPLADLEAADRELAKPPRYRPGSRRTGADDGR